MTYFDVVMTWRTRVEAEDEQEAKENACEVLHDEMEELDYPTPTARYEVDEVK